MNQTWPLFLTVFFSIFHMVGAAAMGQGLRMALRGSDNRQLFCYALRRHRGSVCMEWIQRDS
jgi:hypothetical protein